jgi:hypothetical protein
MRHTLLAWQMTKNKTNELNADDWLHLDIIPENNYKGLLSNGYRPLAEQSKQGALQHCLNYFINK